MIIRKATLKDVPVLKDMLDKERDEMLSLHKGALRKLQTVWERKASAYKLKKSLKSSRVVFLIAEVDGKVAGFIAGELQKPPGREEGFILDIFVYDKYRRQGIGDELMAELSKWFKKNKCKWLSLIAYTKNTKAKKFYDRLGFKAVCEIRKKKI